MPPFLASGSLNRFIDSSLMVAMTHHRRAEPITVHVLRAADRRDTLHGYVFASAEQAEQWMAQPWAAGAGYRIERWLARPLPARPARAAGWVLLRRAR